MMGIIGKPKYKRMDMVEFEARGEMKRGRVYIVDAYGTFEQSEEPSYDIRVEEENCIYKHMRESWLTESQKTESEMREDSARLNVEMHEIHMRYYSAEPQVLHDETKVHEVKKWSYIKTHIGSIEVKKIDAEAKTLLLVYWDKDYNLKTEELKEGVEMDIEMRIGNQDAFRLSKCVLKII